MASECLKCYQEVCDNIFNRWEALKLAVEHMGGRHGQQTAIEIKNYVFNYCTQNDGVDEREISDILNEIIDEEFDTICEDNSINEISSHLIRYLKLCKDGQLDQVRQELSQLPACTNWLEPGYQMKMAPRDEDSDTESSDDDDDDDQDMETDEAPTLVSNPSNNATRTTNRTPKMEADEDGWTTIPNRRRQR